MNETSTSDVISEPVAPVPEALVVDFSLVEYLPEGLQPAWILLQEYPIVMATLVIMSGYLLGKALQWLVAKSLKRLTERTKTNFDDRLVKLLAAPILQTTVTLALILVVVTGGISAALAPVVNRILVSFLLFFWARAWMKAIHLALEVMSAHRGRFKAFQPRTVPLIEMGLKLFMLGLAGYLFLGIWGINGTAWLASAGVIGIAVGFAAQDTVANLISGVSIVADAPYKIGDFIILDTGERGTVTHLGIRSTRLLTRDDIEISIPNAVIGNAKITNESGGPSIKHRIRVKVGVAYGSDTDQVVKLLEDVAHENSGVVEFPAPRVRMRAFGASSLDFELMGWIEHPEMRGLVRHQLLLEIDRTFREQGVVIPFPQRDLRIQRQNSSAGSDSVGSDSAEPDETQPGS